MSAFTQPLAQVRETLQHYWANHEPVYEARAGEALAALDRVERLATDMEKALAEADKVRAACVYRRASDGSQVTAVVGPSAWKAYDEARAVMEAHEATPTPWDSQEFARNKAAVEEALSAREEGTA